MKTQNVVLVVLGVLLGLPVLACGGCMMLGAFISATMPPPDSSLADDFSQGISEFEQEIGSTMDKTFDGIEDAMTSPMPGVTMQMFQQIQTGMTYNAVVAVCGQPTQQLSQVELAGNRAAVFQWDGTVFASNMTVNFSNGRVAGKAQFGLQ